MGQEDNLSGILHFFSETEATPNVRVQLATLAAEIITELEIADGVDTKIFFEEVAQEYEERQSIPDAIGYGFLYFMTKRADRDSEEYTRRDAWPNPNEIGTLYRSWDRPEGDRYLLRIEEGLLISNSMYQQTIDPHATRYTCTHNDSCITIETFTGKSTEETEFVVSQVTNYTSIGTRSPRFPLVENGNAEANSLN